MTDLKSISDEYSRLKAVAENNIKERTLRPRTEEKLRPITPEELNDILSVIPPPVCILRHVGQEMYKEQLNLLRDQMKDQMIYVNPDKAQRVIAFIKKKLRMHALKGSMVPGTPLGMQVSDDIGASVMQGTLNTRHKAGSRQNASGGLKVQREITALRQRSAPAVTICFSKTQTFEDIMTKWRALLVEIRVKNLIYDPKKDITPISRIDGDPDWYINYSRHIGSDNVYSTTYALEIKIRLDLLLGHSLTLGDVADAITQESSGKYFAIPGPLSDPKIHIIPYASTDTDENNTDPSLLVLGTNIPNILDSIISGLEGIKDILPIATKVIDAIVDEVNLGDGYFLLKLNKQLEKSIGVGYSQVMRLCEASGIEVVDKDPANKALQHITLEEQSGNPKPIVCYIGKFDLVKEIKNGIRNNVDLPRATIKKVEGSNKWTIKSETEIVEEEMNRYEEVLKKLKMTYTKSKKGILTVEEFSKPRSVIETIALRKKQDEDEEADYEQEQRVLRAKLGPEALISVLRPPTEISTSNVHYIAELMGGSMYSIMNIQGLDISRCYSNNTVEIATLLGIEAARNFLIREIAVTWENSDAPLQPLTNQTVVDYMTYRGSLTPYSSHGINSQNIGFMAKTTVSFAMKHIQDASINAEVDPMRSTPARILLAKPVGMGTGMVNIKSTVNYQLPETTEKNNFNENNRGRDDFIEGEEENEENQYAEADEWGAADENEEIF